VDGDLQEFLGKGVVWRWAVLGDVILVLFGSVECSGTTQKLMSELGLARAVVLEDRHNMVRR
jgi:hypothetical protein